MRALSRWRNSIIFTAITLITVLVLLAQTPSFWQQDWIWDNEKLLAFDHIQLIQADANPFELNLARIPSIVPDYALAWAGNLAWNDIRKSYLFYIIAQSACQLVLSTWLLREITLKGWLTCISTVSAITYFIAVTSPAWATNHSLASLPLNHGGNLVMVLLIFCLSIAISHTTTKKRTLRSILGAIILLASSSNRIVVVQAIIPSLLLFIMPAMTSLKKRDRKELCLLIAICSGTGLAISKIILKTGCTPPLEWRIDALTKHLINLFSIEGYHIGIGYLIVLNMLLCLLLLIRSQQPTCRAYALLSIASSATSFTLYPFIFLNQGLGDSNLRYLLPAIFFIPITICTTILIAARSYQRLTRAALLACVIIACMTTLSQPDKSLQVDEFANSFLKWQNPYSEFIGTHLHSGEAALSASEGNYLMSSRSLKAGMNQNIHISQIAGNGYPNPWDQGKSEFYRSQKTRELRNYKAILIETKDHDSATSWYGKPNSIIADRSLDVELWVYSLQGQQAMASRLQQELSGPFRISCP